jgi:RNA polymerase sigma factor (sigma-70 family)
MEGKEKLFKQYRNMINKAAWYFTRKIKKCNDRDTFEDLQAEGFLIFCKAVDSFNPEKASFSTFLYTCLKNGLNSYVKTNYLKPDCVQFDDIFDYVVKNYDQAELFFNEALNEISDSSKEMLIFILSMDEKATRTLLQQYFVSTATFRKIQFDVVFEGLKKWWKENKEIMEASGICWNIENILME